jgi:Asp-tRNA(Asn)/Glu-tRNA(Gln) amidotransferase A subunit family amidase
MAWAKLSRWRSGKASLSFAGNPALAIPIPVNDKDGLVTSLQLVGPRLSEGELLNAGRLVEANVQRADPSCAYTQLGFCSSAGYR